VVVLFRQAVGYLGMPAFFRITIIGHHPLKAD
jgi:hypothetical protein